MTDEPETNINGNSGIKLNGAQQAPSKKNPGASSDEEKHLMEEWEQHMHDFVPEDITTIVIEPRKEVVSHTYPHVV